MDVDFEMRHSERLNSEWVYVIKGGVTGYESAQLDKLIDGLHKESAFITWTACAGTLNKYHRLEIPMSEVIKFLLDQKLITVEREYGYIKKINRCSETSTRKQQ